MLFLTRRFVFLKIPQRCLRAKRQVAWAELRLGKSGSNRCFDDKEEAGSQEYYLNSVRKRGRRDAAADEVCAVRGVR